MPTYEGRYEQPITDDEKADFLDLIANGRTRVEAAQALGHTARKFRALCSPKSDYYDAEFAARYEGLTAAGAEQDAAIVERVEAAFIERAVKDSDRAAEKVLAARDPRYAFLRPKTFTGAINVETLVQILPGVSNETLERMISEAEAQKALPEGVDRVIDAA